MKKKEENKLYEQFHHISCTLWFLPDVYKPNRYTDSSNAAAEAQNLRFKRMNSSQNLKLISRISRRLYDRMKEGNEKEQRKWKSCQQMYMQSKHKKKIITARTAHITPNTTFENTQQHTLVVVDCSVPQWLNERVQLSSWGGSLSASDPLASPLLWVCDLWR